MGLSGNKVKQRIQEDPRNVRWAQDTTAPGFRLLSSMGWTPSAPALGLASSQDLITSGGSSAFSKKISVIPIAKEDNLGIGARRGAGAGLGGLRVMGLPAQGGMGMGFVSASVAVEGEVLEPKVVVAGGGEFGRLLERLNAAAVASRNASENNSEVEGEKVEEGGKKVKKEKKVKETTEERAERKVQEKKAKKEDKKRKRELGDDGQDEVQSPLPFTISAPMTPLLLPSSVTSVPSPSPKLIVNPRMAARSKYLRSKRLATSSNAAAMAEILGIAPESPSATPPMSPLVLSGSINPIPFGMNASTGQGKALVVNPPTESGDWPVAPMRSFPMFASGSSGSGLAATFEAVVEEKIEVEVEAVLEESEKEKLKREKKERKALRKSGGVVVAEEEVEVAEKVVSTMGGIGSRSFPSFTSSSSTGLAATFTETIVEKVEAVEVAESKEEKDARRKAKKARKEEKSKK